jgi:hypothetical protein
MRLHGHRSRLRALTLSGALLACLALPAVASADTTNLTIQPAASRGATITLDPNVRVTSKVVATVGITFKCDPFMVYDWETGETRPSTVGFLEGGQIVLVQASGRTVNTASIGLFGGEVVCDGTTVQSLTASIVASTAPWKSGAAVTGATVYVVDQDYQSSHYASTGAMSVKLTK